MRLATAVFVGAALLVAAGVCAPAYGFQEDPDGWWTIRSVRNGPLLAHFVMIEGPAARDPDRYREAVARLCPGDAMCQVHFWDDPQEAAAGLPFTDAQADAKAAGYFQNPHSGALALTFACRILDDPEQCFSTQFQRRTP
jgi:hypothetical protein